MNDVELNEKLVVHTEGNAGPYLMVPLRQLPSVEEVLRSELVGFSVSRDAVQIDGHEAVVLIDFGRRADASRIQTILDAH